MMEENNDISLIGGLALVYLTGPMHKKYSTTFLWGHPFSKYVFNPFPSPFPNSFLPICTHLELLLTYFKHSRTYELNNMMQMLHVNENSNIKYNIIQVKLN